MKNFERWLWAPLILLLLGGSMGAVYYAQSTQLRKDIETRLSHLRESQTRLDAAYSDLSAAQRDLAAAKSGVHTFAELQALRARMAKDQSDIQTLTADVLGDIQFLQGQWSSLTPEERDFVSRASRSLS